MLAKSNRLNLRKVKVEKIFKEFKRYSSSSFFCYYQQFLDSEKPPTQVALIISKKVSLKAVVRNKIKRQILNIICLFLSENKNNYKPIQVLIVVKKTIIQKTFLQIKQEIAIFFNKINRI